MRLIRSLIEMSDDVYDREKKVSVLILKAFRKAGITVSEYDGYGGTKDKGDLWASYVLYDEGDGEATVKVDECDLDQLVALSESGLFDGPCSIEAASDSTIRFTFKVHPALKSGTATID